MIRHLVSHIAAFLMLNAFSVAYAHDYPVDITRWVDADTFDGTVDLGVDLLMPGRFRVMCINAPESRGRHASDAGKAMSDQVTALGIVFGTVEIVERDVFGRWLVYLSVPDWEVTFNKYLYDRGAPLYSRLTRAEKAECLRRLE